MSHPPQQRPPQPQGFQPQPGNPAPPSTNPAQPSANPGQPSANPAQRPGHQGQPSAAPASQSSALQPRAVAPSSQASVEPISPVPQRDVEPRLPQFRRFELLVTTGEGISEFAIEAVIGPVFGVVTRPKDLAHSPEMAYLVTEARQDAVEAMVEQARQAGANAVVAMRFDGGQLSETVAEITAYGTAVRVRKPSA